MLAGRGVSRSSCRDRPHLERVLTAETIMEQEFLVAAVSHPAAGQAATGWSDPDHFVDPVHREAFIGLRMRCHRTIRHEC